MQIVVGQGAGPPIQAVLARLRRCFCSLEDRPDIFWETSDKQTPWGAERAGWIHISCPLFTDSPDSSPRITIFHANERLRCKTLRRSHQRRAAPPLELLLLRRLFESDPYPANHRRQDLACPCTHQPVSNTLVSPASSNISAVRLVSHPRLFPLFPLSERSLWRLAPSVQVKANQEPCRSTARCISIHSSLPVNLPSHAKAWQLQAWQGTQQAHRKLHSPPLRRLPPSVA